MIGPNRSARCWGAEPLLTGDPPLSGHGGAAAPHGRGHRAATRAALPAAAHGHHGFPVVVQPENRGTAPAIVYTLPGIATTAPTRAMAGLDRAGQWPDSDQPR